MAKISSIKIDADFKSVLSGFGGIEKALKSLSSKKFGVNIDDSALKKFKTSALETYSLLEAKNKQLSKTINDLTRSLDSAMDPKKYKAQAAKISEAYGEILKNQVMMNRMSGGGIGATSGGGISSLAKFIPGLSRFAGPAAIASLGYGVWNAGASAASDRLALMGMGYSSGQIGGAEAFGRFSSQENRQQALLYARATGNKSLRGLRESQDYAVSIGMAPESLIGAQGAFRAAGSKDTLGTIKNIYIEALAAGFDQSRMPELLEMISNNVGKLSEQHLINPNTIPALITRMMAAGKEYRDNPQLAMAHLGALEQDMLGKGKTTYMSAIYNFRRRRGQTTDPLDIWEYSLAGMTGRGGYGELSPAMMLSERLNRFGGGAFNTYVSDTGQLMGLPSSQNKEYRLARARYAEELGKTPMEMEALIRSAAGGKIKQEDLLTAEQKYLKQKEKQEADTASAIQNIDSNVKSINDILSYTLGIGVTAAKLTGIPAMFDYSSSLVKGDEARKNDSVIGSMLGGIWGGAKNIFNSAFGISDANASTYNSNSNMGGGSWSGTTATNETINQNAKIIYDKLTKKYGWSHAQAMGVIGSAYKESKIQANPKGWNDAGQSGGIWQWHKSRLRKMATAVPDWKTNFEAQVDYLGSATEEETKQYLEATKDITNPLEANKLFEQIFERPKYLKRDIAIGNQAIKTLEPIIQTKTTPSQFEEVIPNSTNGNESKIIDKLDKLIDKKQKTTPAYPSELTDMSMHEAMKAL